jgi:hypothetical protein
MLPLVQRGGAIIGRGGAPSRLSGSRSCGRAIGALLSLVPVATTNDLKTWLGWLNVTSERSLLLLTRQAEPPTLVTNESHCYHFRVLDPRLPLRVRL